MNDETRLDAEALIVADLDRRQRAKRWHFVPAVLLGLLGIGGMLVISGVRRDLFEQAPWELVTQISLWLVCLVLLPAIGVGLWFPKRATRIALAFGAVLLTVVSTTGFEFHAGDGGHLLGCGGFILAFGAGLLAVGVVSGAFIQRRRSSAAYWVAGGVSLTALNTLTWHCPMSGLAHVMPAHVGGAVALMAMASVVGWLAHRRRAGE
jgi:hypothetical protein